MKSRIIITIILAVGGISVGISYAWTSLGTDDMYILTGKKLGFDGGTGKNYINQSNNNLSVIVNGIDSLFISSTGNVGIGTTNPTTGLDLSRTSADAAITAETTTSGSAILDLHPRLNQDYKIVGNRTSNQLEINRPGLSVNPIMSFNPNTGNVAIHGNLTTSSANKEFRISAPAGVPICIGTGC